MKYRILSMVIPAVILLFFCPAALGQGGPPDFSAYERFIAEDCSFAVLLPRGWQAGGQPCGNGVVISVFDPKGPSAVRMTQMNVGTGGGDSVAHAAAGLRNTKTFYPDMALDLARASGDRSKTVVEYRYTSPRQVPMRTRSYFLLNGPLLTIFEYETAAPEFARMQPMLLNVLTNITILDPSAYRRPQAAGAVPKPPISLPMSPRVVKDRSCGMLVPEGWSCDGGKGSIMTVSPGGDAGYIFTCVDFYGRSNIPYFDSSSIPGGLHYDYMMPADALAVLLQAYGASGIQVVERSSNPAKASQIAAGLRRGADAEIVILTYTTKKGARVRGYFDVASLRPLYSGQWGLMMMGTWAPDAEFDRWLPTLVQMSESFQINLEWARQYIQAGLANLRRLMKETAAKAAKAAQDIRNASNAAYEERQRSQAYIDYKRTSYIRGEQEWIAGAEGGKMVTTDAWGMRRNSGEYVAEGQDFNYYNYRGQDYGLTPVDASREVYESVYGH